MYYGLALFDVIVVGMGLLLNHMIIDTHNQATGMNMVWEKRLDRILDLGTVAGKVNAPGNDVFESRAVAAESARQRKAMRRFDVLMTDIRHDLREVSPGNAAVLRADLREVDDRMQEMVREARRIFRYFDRGRADLAGRRMAAMDRRYHDVNKAITRTREDVGEIQQGLFDVQKAHARDLRDFEYLIALFVVLMISCATAYGHRIKRELEAREAERADHIRRLEEGARKLREANAALIDEVAARNEVEARLRASEERYSLAARGANDGLWDWNLDTGEVYFSPRWLSLLGFIEDELSGDPDEWLDRVHPEDLPELEEQLLQAEAHARSFQIEHRMRDRDGDFRWFLVRGIATVTDGERRLVGSHSDVTARKQAELDLVHDSLHDALTGLPNRVLFLERLDHVLKRAQRTQTAPYAVMYVDLDRFKQVNDGLGHLAGDELLTRFADVLRRNVRPGDTAARLGGDEFAILLEDVRGDDEARHVAHRILGELAEPIAVNGTDVHISASIGLASGRCAYTTTTEVLRNADAALYAAKRDGRGRLQEFQPDHFEHIFDALRLEIDLRGAVARGEMYVVYQPIVSLDSGRLAGVETLVRWTHPELGPVPPSTFIPIAEESGAITEIGEWVLERACRDVATGLRTPALDAEPLFVTVNVSPQQLRDDALADRVLRVLEETGLPPSRLKLEVTESSVMRDREQAIALLHRLRGHGIRICIDDFGTGHSALSYVQDLPVDGIKIDRSFVSRLSDAGTGNHIVRAIVDLAHHTGLDVIAEGVETADQRAALLGLACEYGQGYYFSGPLDLAMLRDVLTVERHVETRECTIGQVVATPRRGHPEGVSASG